MKYIYQSQYHHELAITLLLLGCACCKVVINTVDITVMFNQTTYSVNENAGPAQPVLVLSNPSSTDITVQVFNTDGSATGEYCSILNTIMV